MSWKTSGDPWCVIYPWGGPRSEGPCSQGKSVAEVVRRQFLLIGTHHKDGQQKVYPLIHPKSGVLTHQWLIGVTKYHSRAKLHDVKGFLGSKSRGGRGGKHLPLKRRGRAQRADPRTPARAAMPSKKTGGLQEPYSATSCGPSLLTSSPRKTYARPRTPPSAQGLRALGPQAGVAVGPQGEHARCARAGCPGHRGNWRILVKYTPMRRNGIPRLANRLSYSTPYKLARLRALGPQAGVAVGSQGDPYCSSPARGIESKYLLEISVQYPAFSSNLLPGARGQLAELRDNWKSGASVFVAAQREYKEMERKAKEHDYQQSSIGQVDNKRHSYGWRLFCKNTPSFIDICLQPYFGVDIQRDRRSLDTLFRSNKNPEEEFSWAEQWKDIKRGMAKNMPSMNSIKQTWKIITIPTPYYDYINYPSMIHHQRN
ncbi:33_t:CDS:10 [Funneliformis geosporum]|nr:33_t:CDS:10 [Funneliformis geosporum]